MIASAASMEQNRQVPMEADDWWKVISRPSSTNYTDVECMAITTHQMVWKTTRSFLTTIFQTVLSVTQLIIKLCMPVEVFHNISIAFIKNVTLQLSHSVFLVTKFHNKCSFDVINIIPSPLWSK